MQITYSQKAFSLVELSIVLVILGLLTGGVLTGQSLIRASELRAVVTEYQRYISAMGTFRDKYFALPGDMTNATSFWGTDPGGCPGDNTTSTTARTTTCNGDGNGQLTSAAPASNEAYRAWQHLANAGMVEGQYTGVINATGCCVSNSITTPNVPKSKITNGMWYVGYVGVIPVSSLYYFDGNYANTLHIASGGGNTGGLFKPEEAWNIDVKLDDGKPGIGTVRSMKTAAQANATTGCSDTAYSTATSIASASAYLLTNSSIVCSLTIKTGY